MTKIYILNGPDLGKVFDLEKDTIYIGRSPDNDIQIRDRTVSRKHLRIRRKDGKFLLTDLRSRNGTFFNGNYLSPGIELDVREGVPIMIGMSIICIGQGCLEQLASFIESTKADKAIDRLVGIHFTEKRKKPDQRRRELTYKINEILMDDDIKKALEEVLGTIFALLKRVDRAVIVISDPETGNIREVIYRSKRTHDNAATVYCKEVVERVLRNGKAVMISDCHADTEDDLADTLKIFRIESVMCVPLIGTSKISGALYVDSLNKPYGFRKEDLSLFYDLGRRTALAIEYGWFRSRF
ncbi:MAG: FHA domain-containing protein [Deltaproteobacteria bacterium]|nr:FHA domain-containing protein [Deltaproteobacteria bacterium]